MALSGQKLTLEQTLLAKISDDLAFIAWAQTEDARKNRNRPKSVLQELLGEHKREKLVSLTAEEFDRRWKELTGG